MTDQVYVCYEGGGDWEGQWQDAKGAFLSEAKANEWVENQTAAKENARMEWKAWDDTNPLPRRNQFATYEAFAEAEAAHNKNWEATKSALGMTYADALNDDSFWYEAVELLD